MDLFGLPGGDITGTLKVVGGLVFGYVFILWVASVLWVYKDIRSRTRDPLSQLIAVSISVVFPLIGLPVYLVLRPSETLNEAYVRQLEQEAILSDLHSISACPNCRRPVQDDFQVCAHCATPLRQACVRCGKLLQFSWRHCPYCANPREVARAQRATATAQARPRPEGAAQPARPPRTGSTRPAPAQRTTATEPLDEPAAPSTTSTVHARPAQGGENRLGW